MTRYFKLCSQASFIACTTRVNKVLIPKSIQCIIGLETTKDHSMKKIILIITALILINNSIHASSGKGVLCLYKNKMEKNRIINKVFPILKKLGLKPALRSLNTVPNMYDLKNKRAVLTWSSTGLYKYPKKFLGFLSKTIKSGRKAILIGGLGAYGKKVGKKDIYLDPKQYNLVFNKLGLNFKGFWTGNGNVLRVIKKNRSMVEKQIFQSPRTIKHYFKIDNIDNKNTVHLTVRRTDYKKIKFFNNPDSTFIVTGPAGGFCLEYYEGRYHGGKYKMMLNLEKFLEASLFYKDNIQKFMIVYDARIRNSKYKYYLSNIGKALELTKISYVLTDSRKLNKMISRDLENYTGIILAIKNLTKLPKNIIKKYVKNGGKLIALRTEKIGNFSDVFGIKKLSNYNNNCKSIIVKSPLLLGRKSYRHFSGLEANVPDVTLRRGAKILWYGKNDNSHIPLLWKYGYGKGKSIYWNAGFVGADRNTRGLILESLMQVSDILVGGLVNIAMIWMDDCPAPLWNANYRKFKIKMLEKTAKTAKDKKQLLLFIKRLKTNYKTQLDSDFMEKVWVPDMFRILKKYNIPMSFYLIFNYNQQMKPPFKIKDFFLAKNNLPFKLAKKILESGHELGFHGFNHQSLTTKKTALGSHSLAWSVKNMYLSLIEAKKAWIKLFGKHNLPTSYVAPHNVIDKHGIITLKKTFPSINTIGTLYNKGEYETDTDFGNNKYNEQAFNIPRTSSGFGFAKTSRLNLLFSLSHFGVVSHFLHPDDYIDRHRSYGYKGWGYLKKRFIHMIKTLKHNYPWLEYFQVRDARNHFKRYLNKGVLIKRTGNILNIEVSQSPYERPFFFRVKFNNKRFRYAKGCQVVFRYPGNRDIIFKTKKTSCKIYLR